MTSPDVAVLVDYDGTIATADISDELVRRFASTAAWDALESAYRAGEMGSRELLEAEARLLPDDPDLLGPVLAQARHDPGFVDFVAFAASRSVIVEIVSDGLGYQVREAIATAGMPDVAVFTADLRFGPDGPSIRFPAGNPACAVCGTCKRDRVLTHQAAGRHVVYVGDGFSDQYAIAYADTVFAKGELVGICVARGIDHRRWQSFDDIQGWLTEALTDHLPGPLARPFICGPEVRQATPDKRSDNARSNQRR